jgi:hypothetical protein
MYALAREQRADQYFDEIIEYADQATPENVNVKRLEVDWANELHPTEPGFRKIAAKFLSALRHVFPGRI